MIDTEPMPLALQRKLAGLCPRCGQQGRDDADVCEACRVALNAIQRSFRLRRREAGKCRDCGKRSKTLRCRTCTRRLLADRGRVISARSRVDQTVDSQTGGFRTTHEVDIRYAEGRTRQRYIGRGRRGAPSRAELEADDVRGLEIAAREWGKGLAALREAGRLPEDMPRIQRAAARREALSAIGLAVRLGLEVMERNGIAAEAFDRGEDDGEDGEE